MLNLISFHAIDNSNRHEARKAILADLTNSKPFSIPAGAPAPASSPPPANAPVSTPSKVQNETYSNSQDYRANSAFMQVDSQRENFLQKYVKEEEEEEDKKDEGLVDYLLEALKGEEKEAHMEGNSYMSDGVKAEYYQRNFPGLFGSTQGM